MLDIAKSLQYEEEPTCVDNTDRQITKAIVCLYALFENWFFVCRLKVELIYLFVAMNNAGISFARYSGLQYW